MNLYRFSSKYAKVRVVYVGIILVPIAVLRVSVVELERVILKDFFYIINDKFGVRS